MSAVLFSYEIQNDGTQLDDTVVISSRGKFILIDISESSLTISSYQQNRTKSTSCLFHSLSD